jgi:rhamnogalacturonyl hydrolase YesR
LGVVEIKNADELENYYKNSDYDFLIQEKINFKNEVGIFYHRFPDEKTGKLRNGKKEFSM